MTITDGEKTMTLEELAQKICDSYAECVEGECPAFACCFKGGGMIKWLREVVGND